MNTSEAAPQLGRIGAWFHPKYDDDTRIQLAVEAEALVDSSHGIVSAAGASDRPTRSYRPG